MTSTIVCGVDGSLPSRAAARLASALADASGQAVQFVFATGSAEFGYAFHSAKQVRERVNDALGREVPLRVLPGAPAEQLLLAARGASLLVLGIGSRSALSRAIRPGVSTSVARDAAVPLIAVPEGVDDPAPASRRVLVCAVRDARDLACAASSAWLARELDLQLTLVHAVAPPRVPIAPAGGAPPPALPASAADRAAEGAALLDDVACAIARCAPAVCRTRVVHGDVGRALDVVADEENAFLVALGQSRHRALGRPLGRRCARRLLRRRRRAVAVFPTAERIFAFDGPPAEPAPPRGARSKGGPR
jgi:nucleotide-binding universal stress UspA family protein